jgi:CheY-specific phosphatase CheX
VSRARDSIVSEFLASAILLIRATTGVDAKFVPSSATLRVAARPGEAGACPTRREASYDSDATAIAVRVGATGALCGITWVFPAALVVEMIRRALPGSEPRPALREAAATELANILTGRCAETLAIHGIVVEIEPPHIVTSIDEGVCVHLASKVGMVDVVFHLRKVP